GGIFTCTSPPGRGSWMMRMPCYWGILIARRLGISGTLSRSLGGSARLNLLCSFHGIALNKRPLTLQFPVSGSSASTLDRLERTSAKRLQRWQLPFYHRWPDEHLPSIQILSSVLFFRQSLFPANMTATGMESRCGKPERSWRWHSVRQAAVTSLS